jgi:hypothetical protein
MSLRGTCASAFPPLTIVHSLSALQLWQISTRFSRCSKKRCGRGNVRAAALSLFARLGELYPASRPPHPRCISFSFAAPMSVMPLTPSRALHASVAVGSLRAPPPPRARASFANRSQAPAPLASRSLSRPMHATVASRSLSPPPPPLRRVSCAPAPQSLFCSCSRGSGGGRLTTSPGARFAPRPLSCCRNGSFSPISFMSTVHQ